MTPELIADMARGAQRSHVVGIGVFAVFGLIVMAAFPVSAVFPLLWMLLVILVIWLGRRMIRRRLTNDLLLGSVLRTGFGAHDYTFSVSKEAISALSDQYFLTPRTVLTRDYTEIARVRVSPTVVIVAERSRPMSPHIHPRELYPDEALTLMSRYCRITGPGRPAPESSN